jgi:hypothetical protein
MAINIDEREPYLSSISVQTYLTNPSNGATDASVQATPQQLQTDPSVRVGLLLHYEAASSHSVPEKERKKSNHQLFLNQKKNQKHRTTSQNLKPLSTSNFGYLTPGNVSSHSSSAIIFIVSMPGAFLSNTR